MELYGDMTTFSDLPIELRLRILKYNFRRARQERFNELFTRSRHFLTYSTNVTLYKSNPTGESSPKYGLRIVISKGFIDYEWQCKNRKTSISWSLTLPQNLWTPEDYNTDMASDTISDPRLVWVVLINNPTESCHYDDGKLTEIPNELASLYWYM